MEGAMEERKLPFSRIRAPRTSDPRGFTAQAHRASHLTTFVEPVYPTIAKAEQIEGKVVLDAVIGCDGAVKDASLRTGPPLLAESALEALRLWLFRPTTVNGIPVEVQTDVEIAFTLPDSVVIS
jgi:TonB family protein